MARHRLWVAMFGLAFSIAIQAALGQQAAGGAQSSTAGDEVRRVRGVVDKDESWSGTVLITDDVTIQDATVTVNPGTTVEFAQAAPDGHPTLTVGTALSASGELRVLATAQQPVTFRTREATNPGRIVVNVRSRIVYDQPRRVVLGSTSRPTSVPNELTWRYVRFEKLGCVRAKRANTSGIQVVEPAVEFNLLGGPHRLHLSNCTFTGCSRVEIHMADGAGVNVADSSFSEESERLAVQVLAGGGRGGSRATAQVSGNVLSAAVRIEGAVAIATDNVVVGPDACLVVKEDRSAESRIADNYVHNTTAEDEGRYCLNCENPAALIEGNILRGGTMCVLSGSRNMSDNVFIGAAKLNSRYVKNARTHQLVAALPQEATFERNLLLGPAYSMLIPQPAVSQAEGKQAKGPTIIQHNLFDGFGESSRAIHLNPADRLSASVAVMNNVFLRVPTLLYDEAGTKDTLAYADYNAAAPTPRRPFDQVVIQGIEMGKPGWAAKDIRFDDIAGLRLAAAPEAPPADFDGELLAKKATVAHVRKRLFGAYRPLAGSPLIGAGRSSASSGAAGQCMIGPSEPGT